jgi:ribosomal protein S18 acetylase RimI-like enzyme
MPLEVRLLRRGDEAVLATVAEDVFDDPLDREAVERFLGDPRHQLAVAIDNGTVVGFASAVRYEHPDKPQPELWINEVGVASTHHRQGIANRLLGVILDAARQAQCSEAWVLTDRSNVAAMRLYASAGGEEASGEHVMFNFPLHARAIRSQ